VTLAEDLPLWISGQSHEIIHAEADKVWLHDVSQVQPETIAVQTQPVGDLRAIFEAFHEQWQRRWCRHDNTPFTHWAELIAFAKRVVNPTPVSHLIVDGDMLRDESFRKKKRAATGLDGVSRQDLIQADKMTLQSLANLFARAECDGAWPIQLLAGKVHSLAKLEGATLASQYRPITIFGLPYRAWSSIQSRHLLTFAESWVDDSVYGNRRGRQASDLWAYMLQQIENAYATTEPISGISADLEKCFNCIPRFPALCLAVLVGTPNEVTTAWAGALSLMRRHFKVRDSYSDGFLTSTGLAEGCGLSVFGMLLVDHLFALWLKFQLPAIRCLTYVDDWQTFSVNPDLAVKQLDLIEQYASMLDLTVDRKKTFGWSTCPDTRRNLRSSGIQVLHHARELGGHFGISRQYTNRTLTQRMKDLDDFWEKLRLSKTQYHAKVYMLRAVAWPRGLHAVASAPVGDQHWVSLRRSAVKAIGFQRPGVNPSILLGLVEPLVDPELLAVLWTCRSLRTQSPADFWSTVISPLAHGDFDLPPNSLASIALDRVQSVGFHVDRQGMLVDSFGSFCPITTNPAEVDLRLTFAWPHVVAHKVAHRADFAGIEQANLAATRKAFKSLGLDLQGMYRFGLSGGLFTERYKSKWTTQTDACPWCGEVDTLKHRYWQCPQHHDLRTQLAPDIAGILDLLPPALSLRGWAVLPPTWPAWMTLLASLPSDLPPLSGVLSRDGWNEIFADGSCLASSCPLTRCAAWSVTRAPSFSDRWTPGGAQVLCASYLSGVCQTAFRAELFAVAYILHWAAQLRAPVRLWIDCLGVLTKFQLLVWGNVRLKANRSNADLWRWVLQSVETLGRDNICMCKVAAHRTLHSATSKFEVWQFFHNDYADRAARLANQARPPEFWAFWETHVRATDAAERIFQQVFQLHVAVGRRFLCRPHDEEGPSATVQPKETRAFEVHFVLGGWTGTLLPKLARLYGSSLCQKVIRWFFARLVQDSTVQPIWISFAQLYVDFQLATGHPGPLRVRNEWVNTDQRPYIEPDAFSFKQRTKWFRQMIKWMLKEAGTTAAWAQCRPQSGVVQAFIPAISLPWDQYSLAEVERWMETKLAMPCVRDASALCSLPLAARHPRLQVD